MKKIISKTGSIERIPEHKDREIRATEKEIKKLLKKTAGKSDTEVAKDLTDAAAKRLLVAIARKVGLID